MKVMQKYFLAIVPDESLLAEAENLKLKLREKFGIKYALRSPAHVTVKMPFSYNEAKEGKLVEKLKSFLAGVDPFEIEVNGVDNFRNRVVFWNVEANERLNAFQQALKIYCKRELNLVDELSDRNFHPHMTIAFKDIKPKQFDEVYEFVKGIPIHAMIDIRELTILKRLDSRWVIYKKIKMGKQ